MNELQNYIDENHLSVHDFVDLSIKPNYKSIGKRFGSYTKAVVQLISGFKEEDLERVKNGELSINGIKLTLDDIECKFIPKDVDGWGIAVDKTGKIAMALDLRMTPELIREGIANELIAHIQKLRKEMEVNILLGIKVKIKGDSVLFFSIGEHIDLICNEASIISIELELGTGETNINGHMCDIKIYSKEIK